MVQYADGVVIAQMGAPDMRNTIAYSLGFPERLDAGVEPLNFSKIKTLTFEEPDLKRFPQLGYAYDALKLGGAASIVLNAANEIGVEAFIQGKIGFTDIARLCHAMMYGFQPRLRPTWKRFWKRIKKPENWLSLGSKVLRQTGELTLTLLTTIAAFAVTIGILITFHELGHYLVARLCGVKILRFSLGFGKPIFIYKRKNDPDATEWAVSALPLGGYVRMLDARDPACLPIKPEDKNREFGARMYGSDSPSLLQVHLPIFCSPSCFTLLSS